ncbi:hypothetical protein ASG40_16680 [Methylobacterium sp. Leaf399]|uniref:hypothetical protein n=1 Tax=unclassified Methylobacterium TaxID=2615210 RepID=UPI0006FBDB8F|nr:MULTISPECIES: hypothetical protein [unclassified Methylobacterium]KQT18696.1 hypothetical protein ASG40_16680 [Methylobacterium sp. Leaf399]KQT88826.1 hypothetical protein ASG59_14640 [Methylobacterium sp. Leaf466]
MGLAPGHPLLFAVRHLNASSADPIGENDLLEALRADIVPARYERHVRDFLDEADVEALSDLVRAGCVTYPTLARHARRYLDPRHETQQWLDDRA